MEFLNDNFNIEGMFQKFIINSYDYISFLRVHWKNNREMKGYLIGKKLRKAYIRPNAKKKQIIRNMSNIKDQDEKKTLNEFKSDEALLSYAHKIIAQNETKRNRIDSIVSDFNYLRIEQDFDDKSCVIHLEPSKSTTPITSLKDELLLKCYQPWDEATNHNYQAIDENIAEKFLVNTRNPKNTYVTEIKKINPKAKTIISEVSSLLISYFLNKKKNMKQITLDIMKNDDVYVIINCDKIQFDENYNDFHEFHLLKNNSFEISMTINSNELKLKEDLPSIPIDTIPSKRYDSPIVNTRKLSTIDRIYPIKNTTIEVKNPNFKNLGEKLERFITKIDNISINKGLNPQKNKEILINSYEENFPSYAMGLKQEQMKNKRESSFSNQSLLDKSFVGAQVKENSSMTTCINDYNSMMIHVRRLNLKNKPPLIDNYGGEEIWRNIAKSIYSKVFESEHLKKYFCNMTKDAYKGMICKGLLDVFNSNISIEFRRIVRLKHKKFNISKSDFKSFGSLYNKALLELKIKESDLEIINDNYFSFLSAVTSSH